LEVSPVEGGCNEGCVGGGAFEHVVQNLQGHVSNDLIPKIFNRYYK
jgi:hypothetical protein